MKGQEMPPTGHSTNIANRYRNSALIRYSGETVAAAVAVSVAAQSASARVIALSGFATFLIECAACAARCVS